MSPEIVLTHSPVDYMEDHMNASRLAVTAAFSRSECPISPSIHRARPPSIRSLSIMPNHSGTVIGLRRLIEPDFYVDVTRCSNKKSNVGQTRKSETVAG